MPIKQILVTALLVLVSREPATGQSIPSPYRFFETRQEVTTFGGWIDLGTGRFGYGPRPGPMFGARYGLELTGPLSVEGVVTWIPTTRDVVDPRRQEGQRVIGSTDALLLGGDARLRLSLTGARAWHRLNPFLVAGAGLMADMARTPEIDSDLGSENRFKFGTTFTADLGGGLRWFVSDRWIVRGDARLHVWRLAAPDGFRDPDRGFGDVGKSEWVNASAFSTGVGYRF